MLTVMPEESRGVVAVVDDEPLTAVVDGYRLRGATQAQVTLAPAPDPLRVRGVPERLTAVFENLLDNAVSFSPPGGTVVVALVHRPGWAVVTVTDDGPGLPAGSEALIFSRFYSFRPASEKSDAGHTGLGLALVKAIVEGYGGAVTGATRPEGGAVFTVRLPSV
jgi:two-component system, OmpR family, sensor histidine kinase ChvG